MIRNGPGRCYVDGVHPCAGEAMEMVMNDGDVTKGLSLFFGLRMVHIDSSECA